jgi:hypothetical protein
LRRIFQNILAAILAGLMWVGFMYWQLRGYVLAWQVFAYAFGFGFGIVMFSTSIIGIFIKDPPRNNHLEVEILKAGED